MEPPNKGHVGDNINSAVLSFVHKEVVLLSELEVQNVLELTIFGTLTSVLCREVYYTACVPISEGPLSEVSLYW